MKFSAVIALALSLSAHAVSLQGDVPSSAELGTTSHMAPNGGPGFDQSFGPPDAGSIVPDEQAEEDFSGAETNMPFVGNALQKRQSAEFRKRFALPYNRFGPRFQVRPVAMPASPIRPGSDSFSIDR